MNKLIKQDFCEPITPITIEKTEKGIKLMQSYNMGVVETIFIEKEYIKKFIRVIKKQK